MTRLRTLWLLVQGDPVFMRRFTGWGIWASILLWAFAQATNLVYSVAWVSHLSQLALVLTMLSWWQSARVEAAAAAQMEEMVRRVVTEVVQELIKRTTIEKSPTADPEQLAVVEVD